MSKEKNILMDVKFNDLTIEKKLELLKVDESILKSTRFKGLDTEIVVYDLWNGKTNSEKRSLLKSV